MARLGGVEHRRNYTRPCGESIDESVGVAPGEGKTVGSGEEVGGQIPQLVEHTHGGAVARGEGETTEALGACLPDCRGDFADVEFSLGRGGKGERISVRAAPRQHEVERSRLEPLRSEVEGVGEQLRVVQRQVRQARFNGTAVSRP